MDRAVLLRESDTLRAWTIAFIRSRPKLKGLPSHAEWSIKSDLCNVISQEEEAKKSLYERLVGTI